MTTPTRSGYANVNGIRLYHEIYGAGDPLVLLPGGLMTIPEMSVLLEPLARTNQVIAVELQGHGRTADTDRPLSLATMGDDIAALLDDLDIDSAHLVGYSHGADVALRTAFQHPQKIRRLVVISTPFALDGWYREAQDGMGAINAGFAELLKNTPTAQAAREWPQPERFARFLDKMGEMKRQRYNWSDEVKNLTMPVMLVYADHDSVSQRHIAEFFALLGGGISEPGWQNTTFTNARLAIVPGYSHYNFMSSTELAPIIAKFLSETMTGPSIGVSAAASVAPARE